MEDTLVADRKNLRICWKFMADNWAAGLSSHPAPNTMPYLILKSESEPGSESIRMGAPHLLRGILVSWFEFDRFATKAGEIPETFLLDMIEHFRQVFNADSAEELVLGTAAEVRVRHGISWSLKALQAGRRIAPQSDKILGDMATDTWLLLEMNAIEDWRGAFATILAACQAIPLDRLEPDFAERFCYFHLVACSCLGKRADMLEYYDGIAAERIRHPYLREKLELLLQHDPVPFSRLKIYCTEADQ